MNDWPEIQYAQAAGTDRMNDWPEIPYAQAAGTDSLHDRPGHGTIWGNTEGMLWQHPASSNALHGTVHMVIYVDGARGCGALVQSTTRRNQSTNHAGR